MIKAVINFFKSLTPLTEEEKMHLFLRQAQNTTHLEQLQKQWDARKHGW
jgi:hypothetical protein